MNNTEKLVRQFLLESNFESLGMLSLYDMFKNKYNNVDISFDDFRDAVNSFDFTLVDRYCYFDRVQSEPFFSSKLRLFPISITEANFEREKLKRELRWNSISRILDDNDINYDYEYTNLNTDDLYEALCNGNDYIIYKVVKNDSSDNKSIKYQITHEELVKQFEDARKEIELYKKIAL